MLPITEQDNPATTNIDEAATLEALRLINDEDRKVASAVAEVLPAIAETIDKIVQRMQTGGRLFYIGTGTSGRLGVLDASEIPPTFGTSPDLVRGIIAGGDAALVRASEASEDDQDAGAGDLQAAGLTKDDSVIGLAASGTTPYTVGAVEHARRIGSFTACITCVPGSPITSAAEIAIVPVVGPEVLTGSTRMKSGTAQKMVLNMISTVTMIRLGYVKGNRMMNLRPTNTKLQDRAIRILIAETALERAAAEKLLAEAGDLSTAIVMAKAGVTSQAAAAALAGCGNLVDKAIATLCKPST